MQREDKERKDELPSNTFKNIYKRLGVKTNLNDEKLMFQFYSIGASKEYTINLK